MKLHLLTACTRPENLPRLSASIVEAGCLSVNLAWHVHQDTECRHVGGQRLKNEMIDLISDGWLHILDDDTILHPMLPRRLFAITREQPDAGLVVVGQLLPGGEYRRPAPGCLAVNQVDAAQLLINRQALGGLRLPEAYAGDGLLAEELAATLAPERIVYLDEPLCYYNRLMWGDL